MTTAAQTGIGTLLVRDVSGTPNKSYPVAELIRIGGPKCSSSEIDVTNHDSIGNYKEFIAGALDGGEITIEGNFIPGDTYGQVAMVTDYNNRTSRDWHLHLPSAMGATWNFTAYIKTFEVAVSTTESVKFNATLRVSGDTDLITDPATGLTTPFFALRDNAAAAVTPTPAAATAVYQYQASIANAKTAIAIQPTAATGSPTIYVNGDIVVSGDWSSDYAIVAGKTRLLVVEVRAANKASVVYRIDVTRAAA